MLVRIKAHPHSKKSLVKKIDPETLEIWLPELPINGQANKKLTELLADYFKVAKSLIILKSGRTAKLKVFEVEGGAQWPEQADLFNFSKGK